MTSTELRVTKAYYIIFTILSPLASALLLLKSKSKPIITSIGMLLFGILGSVFIYVPESDGESHMLNVKINYMDMTLGTFFNDIFKLLTFQPTEYSHDLYKHIISYLSGSLFGIPELIHVFGGLFLGFFFTRVALLVLEDKSKRRMGFLLFSLVTLFFLIRTVTAMNSLRMWTGMWIFFYGAYAFIRKGKYKYLLYIILAILVHFSYLLFTLPLVAAIFLKKYKLLIVGVFIISFFVDVGFQQASNLIGKAGLYEDKVGSNIQSEEYKEIIAKDKVKGGDSGRFYKVFGEVWYKTFSLPLLAFILIIIYYHQKSIPHFDFLMSGGLLIFAFSNLAEQVSPSVYGRGVTIAGTFLLVAAIQLLLNKEKLIRSNVKKNLVRIGLRIFVFSAIPMALFQLSFIFNTFSFFTVIFPMASWYLGEVDISIRDALAALIL